MKKETIDNNSLAHTTWNCKYHIVFAPKYSVGDTMMCYRGEAVGMWKTARRFTHISTANDCD